MIGILPTDLFICFLLLSMAVYSSSSIRRRITTDAQMQLGHFRLFRPKYANSLLNKSQDTRTSCQQVLITVLLAVECFTINSEFKRSLFASIRSFVSCGFMTLLSTMCYENTWFSLVFLLSDFNYSMVKAQG